MTTRKFYFSLKSITKYLAVLLVSAIVLFGVYPMAARADANPLRAESTLHGLLGLTASSRFAAKADIEELEPSISEERLNAMREQRREWQSEVSAAADTENKSEESVGEAIKDKLNLEEIVEENEIIEGIKEEIKKP